MTLWFMKKADGNNMDDVVSPEEKLLRLIRKKNNDKKDSEGRQGQPRTSPALAGILVKDIGTKAFAVLEKTIIAGIIITAGYLCYDSFYIRKDIRNFMEDNENHPAQVEWKKIAAVDIKPFEYYSAQFDKRDIFESPLQKKEGGEAAQAPDITRNFKLVGIVLEPHMPEAIIEDVESKRTLFLHKGDKINSAVVEEILEGKVILTIDDQKIELTQ